MCMLRTSQFMLHLPMAALHGIRACATSGLQSSELPVGRLPAAAEVSSVPAPLVPIQHVRRVAAERLVLLQGIFATHLHSLLDMELAAPRLVRVRMETVADGRFIRATMRMLRGSCTE